MNVRPTSAESLLDPAHAFDGVSFEGRRSLIVAISGGSDSLALLYLIHALREASSSFPAVTAMTVDHGLRPEAADEARYVGQVCQKLGIAHRILAWSGAKPRTGLSAKAREARYALLIQAAREAGADMILTGHTLDDQVETYVMRRQRTHSDRSERGLAGMAPATLLERDTWLVRPLLNQRREVLRDYLRGRGVAWCDDPSNDDPKYERVRIRKAIGQEFEAIRQQLALKAAQRLAVNDGAAHLLQQSVTVSAGCVAAIDTASWRGEPEVQRLALGVLLAVAGGVAFLPPFDLCDKALAHLRDPMRGRITLGRCIVETRSGKALIYREFRSMPRMTLAPCESAIWDGRYRIGNTAHGVIEIMAAGATGAKLPEVDDMARCHRDALRTSPAIRVDGETFLVVSPANHAKLPMDLDVARHLSLFDQILSGYDTSLAGVVAGLFGLPPYKRSPVNQIDKN